MSAWFLILMFGTKTIPVLEYKYERDCSNAATAVRLVLKLVESSSKAEVRCEYKEGK